MSSHLKKIYFWHSFEDGRCVPSAADLQKCMDEQNLDGRVCGVFSAVPSDRADIHDYDGMTSNRQFFSTKVHAVFEGGQTLDCWVDVNDSEDGRWFGYSDYGNLSDMLDEYASEELGLD